MQRPSAHPPPPWFNQFVMLLYRRPQLFVAGIALTTLLLFHWASSTTTTWTTDDDVYESTPMCDPVTGMCGEDAHHPSPRTVFSARSLDQYERWWKAHALLNATAAKYDAELKSGEEKEAVTRTPLILLGDSITESWLGTDMARPVDRAKGVPEILQMRMTDKYRPLVLAIGGDQTQHLLYRLQHGELLPHLRAADNAVFVILIGTNNLGSGFLPSLTADGIQAVAEYVLEETAPGSKVVVQLLLPRGDNARTAAICPPRCADTNLRTPYASFQPAVDKVNEAILQQKAELQRLHPGRFDVMDCGAAFVDKASSSRTGINLELMPDALHPNAAGHEVLATCLLDCLQGTTCSFA